MKKKGNEKIGKEREKSIAERFAEELVEEIKEDFKERQQARRPYELSWQLNMNFLAGNQYCSVAGDSLVEDEKTFEWQEKQVFNHIAPVYETRLAKLSRVRPKMTVRPFTDEDKDVNSAKLAKKILESCSEKLSVNGIIDKGTMWSEACGTVFYKIVWDKEKGVKIKSDDKVYTCGDVSVSVVPPFEIYPDSSVCADLDECKSIIHAKAYSSAEVKEIWGADVKGEELKVFSLDGGVSMGGRSYNKTVPGVTEQVKKDAVLVIERYTRPTKQNPDGELTVVAGDVLVYSGSAALQKRHGRRKGFSFRAAGFHSLGGMLLGRFHDRTSGAAAKSLQRRQVPQARVSQQNIHGRAGGGGRLDRHRFGGRRVAHARQGAGLQAGRKSAPSAQLGQRARRLQPRRAEAACGVFAGVGSVGVYEKQQNSDGAY